jgi:hypothetical protein
MTEPGALQTLPASPQAAAQPQQNLNMPTASHPLHRSPIAGWPGSAWLAAAATALFISACGGGDSSSVVGPVPVAALDLPFDAVGSSARTVSLAWAPAAEARSLDVERRAGNGEFTRVATVDARSGAFLDTGLQAGSTYSYRLAASGDTRRETPARSATTTQEQGVVTQLGAALGELTGRSLGGAGGTLASHDGRITVDVPAGALAGDTATETQPVANTAPGGRGDGLKVRLAAVPRLPLTLTVHYDAAQDDEADALLLAVQRSGGDWTSLPLAAVDKAARTLKAQLPPEFLAMAAAPGVANVGVEFHVVKYLGYTLAPQAALLKVKSSQVFVPRARVRGYDTEIGTCEPLPDGTRACILQPMLEEREIPFTNSKPGYERYWRVNLVQGGNATLGTVVPRGDVGATYTAPARVPRPSTVRVVFHSAHPASGRVMNLYANVDIWGDDFEGTLEAQDGTSDAGTTIFAKAQVRFELDPATAGSVVKRYRGVGTVDVSATDPDCTGIWFTPDSAAIDSQSPAVFLEVDESTSPYRYRLMLVTFWTTTYSATCKGKHVDLPGYPAGWGWELEGRVSADGYTISGEDDAEGGGRLRWNLTR